MDNDSGSDDDNAVEETFTKRPWSQAEDDILLAYIEKHDVGNWNAIAKNSTLSRSGRSCRLRWLNHLRPDLKKGAFTDEEEKRVVELHAEMGNKWSKIAAQLPGRTDNEIKNFWNVRRKRLQRLGLPLYPSEVLERVRNAAAQSGLNPDPLDAPSSPDSLEVDNDEPPSLDLKLLPTNPFLSNYQSMLSNFTPITGSFLRERPCFLQPNMHNSMAYPPGTAIPFMGGGSMNEQSLPPESSSSKPRIHSDINPTYSSSSKPGTSEAQQCDPISSELETDNTLVQPPQTDQTPPIDYGSSLSNDEFLELFRSSGERRATETDSESPRLDISYLFVPPALPPSTLNTTGQPEEIIPFDDK